jgi:hypothetical protein
LRCVGRGAPALQQSAAITAPPIAHDKVADRRRHGTTIEHDIAFVVAAWPLLDPASKHRAAAVQITTSTRRLLTEHPHQQPPQQTPSTRAQRAKAAGMSEAQLTAYEYLQRHRPELAQRVDQGECSAIQAYAEIRKERAAAAAQFSASATKSAAIAAKRRTKQNAPANKLPLARFRSRLLTDIAAPFGVDLLLRNRNGHLIPLEPAPHDKFPKIL